jgi:hypothetical protein
VLVWFGGPFLFGLLLGALFARGVGQFYALLGIGVLVGFFFMLAVYLNAPPDYRHSNGCSHCEMFLGRYWEPTFVFLLASVGYVFYAVALGFGALARWLLPGH